jgi:hypothetical protein
MLWGAVDVSPTAALNVRLSGDAMSEPKFTTLSVTGTAKGLFVASGDVTVMVPV